MLRRKTIGLADLQERYPHEECVGFEPTHEVESCGSSDFVRLEQDGQVGFGYTPGALAPGFARLSTGLWQNLVQGGRVKAREVTYRVSYKAPETVEGAVYFIQEGKGGPVKVGWSQDVPRRRGEGQVFNSSELTVLGKIPGKRALEGQMHELLAQYHIRGEWFRLSPEILKSVLDGTLRQGTMTLPQRN